MKKNFLSISLIACLTVFTACKTEKKNETSANDAETVTETTVEAVKYEAVPEESIIEWKGSKPTGTHTGTISLESGIIAIKDGALESGNFLIDMNTITVTDLEAGDGKEDLEAHLKGTVEGKEDHFFNVAEHPTAYFEVTGIEEIEGKTHIKGNLAIKGTKKNISFPVTVTENGDVATLTSEPFTIDRTNWNVNYGSKSVFDDLGDKFVNDDIELVVKVKAKKA
ncbi:YceI family protein [Galbibacter pacificus]|uniref:YceI family protein n=1 Tax=Galbibacter pacificus TaxID=2996052 RepID=A0ABT6FNV6_9FLAO|nr:YceI family protein [Galbibacter pacificus]MDG3581470.1 YceI family protein [Galbibacter pacificus]MDG3584948.1 YceI family protein [Galbibacter pacificus]